MPDLSSSTPGTSEDSSEALASQFENVQLEEPTPEMAVHIEDLALEKLQNGEQTELLDAIDELRAHQISKHINLPQLIVCGDQSSGKSSLLEAITHLPFPTKDGICTTFATEVALRRSPHREVKVSILPDPSRSDAERARLRRFNATFTNMSDFRTIHEDAKRCMNATRSTGEPDAHGSSGSSSAEKTINDDVLHVDISGPHCTPLTIVDLPGLIQSESRGQTPRDIKIIKKMVHNYMSNERSVILAVVAAHYDFANQGILGEARKVDKHGQRTLGIITKPDRLNEGTDEEEAVVKLADNRVHELALGWHVVKNRDHKMEGCSSEERDRAEREFFEKGAWSSVAKEYVGVDSLRTRLAGILLQQIRKELPALTDEIEKGIEKCEAQLAKLGESREHPQEQRAYLLDISKTFERLTLEAVQGTYHHSFFNPELEEGEESHGRRLRAFVQNSNEDFAYVMQQYGHWNTIVGEPGETDARRASPGSVSTSSLENFAPRPKVISKHEYLEQIKYMVRDRRGRELPGTYNPLLVGDIFRKQARPWAGLAKKHADIVWEAALGFIEALLRTLTEGYTYNALLEKHIQPIMDNKKKDLFGKIDELLKPYNASHLITYSPHFASAIDRIRKKRSQASVNASADEYMQDHFASLELLYCMEAFYQVALHSFVDNIATLAVESCLISDLPEILAPAGVARLTDEELSDLASESEETKRERRDLQDKLKSLKDGYMIVKKHERRAPRRGR